jgi:hypothetical protein
MNILGEDSEPDKNSIAYLVAGVFDAVLLLNFINDRGQQFLLIFS